jgi:hypothetical protein
LAASLIAQYLTENGRPPICFDTDPVNESFLRIKALKAEEVRLLNEDAINVEAVDTLIERILTADTDVVVDNGAASFLPLSRYLYENDIAGLIEGAGKRMVIHTILVGGGNLIDTAKGLEALLIHFPASVQIVVWINEFFGAVEEDGTRFEETPLYEQYQDRIAGIVYLRRQNPQTFGLNIDQMMKRRLTFAEALSDPAFMTVPKQRLTMYRREVWSQLSAVL